MPETDTKTGCTLKGFSVFSSRCVHGPVPAGFRARGLPCLPALLVVLAAAGAGSGCGRTELDPPHHRTGDAAAEADGPSDGPQDVPSDGPPDLGYEAPIESPAAPDANLDRPVVCQPAPETCNGLDDDCDGQMDEELPPIPCPDGGNRYCVGGAYSECPRRCEVCVPGSRRVCFKSFCTYWGSQACASDGRSFGPCEEWHPPAACAEIARTRMRSRELEQCCLENNYCCVDDFDLDGDGDHSEMIGRCEGVACTR